MLNRQVLPRLLILTALASLVAWLAFDAPPAETRWEAIREELRCGSIGRAQPQDLAFLRDTLEWLAPDVGVRVPIVINAQPQPGSLHIYVTTPAAIKVTGCGRGNAIYDATLDAIFVDENIVRPEELPLLGERGRRSMYDLKSYVYVPVYLRFILLHELGHRQLHRRSGGFFDLRRGSRRAEREADVFATLHLQKAYAKDLATGGHRIGAKTAGLLQMKMEEVKPEERVWVDLVGSVSAMSQVLMFSASGFSSFYEDAAHPNFIYRADTILETAIRDPRTSPTLKAHAEYHRESLRRTRKVAESKIAEIQVSEGVQNVTFDDNRLIVMTNGGHIFTAPVDEVEKRIARVNRILNLTQPTAKGPYKDLDEDSAWISSLWATPGLGPVIIQPIRDSSPNVVTLGASAFERYNGLEAATKEELYFPDVYAPPQPAEIAILTGPIGDEEDFLITREGVVTGRVSWGPILAGIAGKAKLRSVRLEIGTVTDETAYLSIYDSSAARERLFGVAEFDLKKHDLGTIHPLRFEYEGGGDAPGLLEDKLVVAPRPTGPSYYLITRNVENLQVYEISSTAPLHLICEEPFILNTARGNGATGDSITNFDPVLGSVRFVPPHYLIAEFKRDSLYSINLITQKATIMFNPGITVKSAVSARGHVGLYVANGSKVYVGRPGKEGR
ncbi:MAG TPA: hypothetical protein VNP98_02960 [Chthoniobacterales bacterium]|nr:hypothetical protein [Chthoniobacterales bacterium]